MSKTIPSPNDVPDMPTDMSIDVAKVMLASIQSDLMNMLPISTMSGDDLVDAVAFLTEAHFRVRQIDRSFPKAANEITTIVRQLTNIIMQLFKEIRARALELSLDLQKLWKKAKEKLPNGTPPFIPEGLEK